MGMKIKLTSIVVEDQEQALRFYTDVLGFEKCQDIPAGEYRWISVVSREGGDTELSLEPNVNPAAKTYQSALFEQGIPSAAFEVDDLDTTLALVAAGLGISHAPARLCKLSYEGVLYRYRVHQGL